MDFDDGSNMISTVTNHLCQFPQLQDYAATVAEGDDALDRN